MNNQDAIKICNAISECIEKDNVVIPIKDQDSRDIINGMKLAISALEKQMEIKPINRGQYEECPKCKNCIPRSKLHIYCGECGQRLERQ